jgi:hypothetical protein
MTASVLGGDVGGGTLSPTGSAVENAGATPEDIDFGAIMQLMTSKYTVELVDRHVGAIRKVCKTCRNGFLLSHLEPLVDLLHLVVQRFSQGQHEFAPAICEFTRVSSQPFVSCKASDMINYGHHLPTLIKGLVSTLSYALPPIEDPALIEDIQLRTAAEERATMNERVRIEVAHCLACWSRFGLDEDSVELRPNQPLIQAVADAGTPNLRILTQSQVMDELSACFRVEDSPEAIVITLGAIRDMSLYRTLARQITNCGLISNLIHVIRVNLLGSDVLLVAAEVLWNVLELDWEGAAEALGQADVIESFRDFMDAVLTRGYRFKDKIFRNDMMVLLMYISKRVENRAFFAETGLMALLLCHAITEQCRISLKASGAMRELLQTGGTGLATADMFRDNSKQGSVALTNSQEDMEFRILLWSTLARCCSDPQCAEVANECLFAPSLLSYLDSNRLPTDQRQWSQEQKRKMQLEALSALFLLVQYMPMAFREATGNAIVLQLLQETTSREVQKKCLHLLQIAVRMGPEFAGELGELGAVGALIELFTDRDVPMGGRQLCISVLAGLCSRNAENCREFRKKGGVEAIREEVMYRPDETTDNHLYCTLCVVDCIWNAIVGTRKNEVRFLDAGGLFALLDVLEIAPLLLKRQIIGCLADLVQYRRAAKLFVQWNSQVTMKGALKILLELWQNEQEAAGSTTGDGVIRDLDRPLNPIESGEASPDETNMQRIGTAGSDSSDGSRAGERMRNAKNFANSQQSFSKASQQFSMRQSTQSKGPNATAKSQAPDNATANADDLGAAVTDRQDCRAKIFSILSCIGFECHEALNIAERQQMELVKLFPDCVQLETWIKVQESLAARGIKAISADRKWIEDSIAERKAQTEWVLGVQQKLADERRSEEQASLHRFYEDIRSRAQFRRTSAKDGQGPSRMTTPAEGDAGYPPQGFGMPTDGDFMD